jgi:hypothetical protein
VFHGATIGSSIRFGRKGGEMRGTVRLFIAAGSIAAVALVVSFVSVSVAGPNVTRLEVVEHATTDTVVDLTTNGDSTGTCSRSTTSCSTQRTRTWSVPTRVSASGSRWA